MGEEADAVVITETPPVACELIAYDGAPDTVVEPVVYSGIHLYGLPDNIVVTTVPDHPVGSSTGLSR